ncbi:C-type mannose receptor 2-like [Labeo rohita]|uniref:C-type mannose receptor 2-like n=1 Tax=Labeo rohita TaxID=84645 RepID=UPI0021E1C583|nr:C-type mannose receptor 2-like [Labeo rohita]
MYTDLATVNNEDEMNNLFKTITDYSYDVYIGLYRGEVFRWHWTLSDSFYNEEIFKNKKYNHTDINNNGGCAAMDNDWKWFNDSCDSQKQFVCFNATANEKYILTEKNKSWTEAQEYCRTFHTDLANVRTCTKNGVNNVWIGLFKDAWSWSDQSNFSFRFWNFSQTKLINRHYNCIVVMVNQTGKWNDIQCNTTLPFICHGDLKPVTTPVTTARQNPNTSLKFTPGPATTQYRLQNTTKEENTSSQSTQIHTTGILPFTSSRITHQYHFINIRKNWTEAQRFCREMYTDLATVNNEDEMNSLFKTITDYSYDVYIGLYRREVFEWHWTLSDSFYNEQIFKNKKNNNADINNNRDCAAMDNDWKWFNDSCDSQKQFVCFNATANEKYILIEKNKSWTEAQEYCRTFHTDLANVRNCTENDVNNVWIGLFKDAWSWSDQSNFSFRFWSFSQKKPINRHYNCTVVTVNQTGKWNDIQCNTTLPFICHGDLKPVTTPVTTSRQNPNTSLKFTPGPATTHYRLQNTTEVENTSNRPKDNLILVRENLTWTEAASYCKKHYVDLVSIHSEELQNRTVRKAIQASTSHVWLGLRYTCRFDFWFWIKNTEEGCYQNWVPGHGPHGKKECGLSGAMESTGGAPLVRDSRE